MALIEEADRVFSINVRVTRADFSGYASCYTCTERKPWRELQCGHFIRRGAKTVRYHKNNARPQCSRCNEELGGREDIFEENLREEIGDEQVDELIAEGRRMQHPEDSELRAIISYFRAENKKYGII